MKANLFIVGAPKCGTTSLAEYLNEDGSIYLPSIKEPHFFKRGLLPPYNMYINDINKYNSLFKTKYDYKYYIDASVWSYISKDIAEDIYSYNPKSKVLFIVRNPIDAIRSLFIHRVNSNNEDVKNINDAIKLEKERIKNRFIPHNIKNTLQGNLYVESYKYYKYIQHYERVFKKNLLVIDFSKLVNKREIVMRDICKFLNIEYFIPSGKIYNKRKNIRNIYIDNIMQLMPISIKIKLKKINYIYNAFNKISNIIPNNSTINTNIDEEILDYIKTELNSDVIKMNEQYNVNLLL